MEERSVPALLPPQKWRALAIGATAFGSGTVVA